MTELDVITGLKGAGKTTFINWMLANLYRDRTCAVVQNEMGKTAVQTALLQNGDKSRLVMTGGCICCTMQTNLIEGIRMLMKDQHPNVILLEPAGIARASDVLSVCEHVEGIEVHIILHLVDGSRYMAASRIMGEVFSAPVRENRLLYINRLESLEPENAEQVLEEVRRVNPSAYIFTEQLEKLDPQSFLKEAESISVSSAVKDSLRQKRKKPVKIRL